MTDTLKIVLRLLPLATIIIPFLIMGAIKLIDKMRESLREDFYYLYRTDGEHPILVDDQMFQSHLSVTRELCSIIGELIGKSWQEVENETKQIIAMEQQGNADNTHNEAKHAWKINVIREGTWWHGLRGMNATLEMDGMHYSWEIRKMKRFSCYLHVALINIVFWQKKEAASQRFYNLTQPIPYPTEEERKEDMASAKALMMMCGHYDAVQDFEAAGYFSGNR